MITSAATKTNITIGTNSIAFPKPDVTLVDASASAVLEIVGNAFSIWAKIRIPISEMTPMTTTLIIVPACRTPWTGCVSLCVDMD